MISVNSLVTVVNPKLKTFNMDGVVLGVGFGGGKTLRLSYLMVALTLLSVKT